MGLVIFPPQKYSQAPGLVPSKLLKKRIQIFGSFLSLFQSQKRLYNHKCLFICLSVRPFVCKTPQQLEIIILHHPSSSFIILHHPSSSFIILHFATFKLFSLFCIHFGKHWNKQFRNMNMNANSSEQKWPTSKHIKLHKQNAGHFYKNMHSYIKFQNLNWQNYIIFGYLI